jgi:hypothetical protein
MDHQRFQDTLEVIKFICKEFWQMLYKKQVDNLRTNHRGVYVLQDNRFVPSSSLYPPAISLDILSLLPNLQDNRFRPLLHVSPDAPAISPASAASNAAASASTASTNPGQPSALGGKKQRKRERERDNEKERKWTRIM